MGAGFLIDVVCRLEPEGGVLDADREVLGHAGLPGVEHLCGAPVVEAAVDVVSSTDARGTAATYAYDSAGNQTTTTTKGGVTTKSLYQGSTDPDYGGTVNCGPTVNNVITATTDGRG